MYRSHTHQGRRSLDSWTSQTSWPLPTPRKIQSSSLRSMTQILEITDEYLYFHFPQLPEPIVLDDFKSPCFQKRGQSPYFSYPRLARALLKARGIPRAV
jgi:hypothetical protein